MTYLPSLKPTDDWIYARTGIRQRFIANEGESTATLAYRAAQQALEVADILPTDLDLIVVATSTPENIFPSTASLVTGLAERARRRRFRLERGLLWFRPP